MGVRDAGTGDIDSLEPQLAITLAVSALPAPGTSWPRAGSFALETCDDDLQEFP